MAIDTWLTSLAFCAFLISTLALAIYGVHLYVLLYLFRRRQRGVRAAQAATIEGYANTVAKDWPIVTSQIPIYNERDVASRVIEAIANMDYPAGRHEIQILDDSDDETCDLVDIAVEKLRNRGTNARVVRRANRKDFKAGALANGLTVAEG